MRRRDLLVLGGLGLAAYGLRRITLSTSFEFTEMTSPKGFRRLALGNVSSANAIFAGLEPAEPSNSATLPPARDPCTTLFNSTTNGNVPVAVFTDVNAPIVAALIQYFAILKRLEQSL